MCEPTDYHRKLAWVINVMLFGKLNRSRLSDIAAALASEGVVDPVEYAEGLVSLARENKRLEQQLDAIRAEAKKKQ